jgi:methylenetetrahydrofolate dehydrogenase (NADP+) / methenyltetrahydrofolate cyclohydrolase
VTVRLLGPPVSERLLETVRRTVVDGAPGRGRPPRLASVHRDLESPFRGYLRQQTKVAATAGVQLVDLPIPAQLSASELLAHMRALDADPTVDAVLLEHPLPPEMGFRDAVGALRPEKDVDGVSSASLGRLASGDAVHVPAVALAALEILRHYEIPVQGQRVAVVGRSPTVGLPLALLLASQGAGHNATVTIAHSGTPDLKMALEGTAIVFSCVGRPGLLDRKNVPREAVVVDIGVGMAPDPAHPGRQRAAGDSNLDDLEGWARAITPVPGGVGPVTVAELMASATRAWQRLGGAYPP